MRTPALQEAPGRQIPPSWIRPWLLELVAVMLAAGLVRHIYPFVLFLSLHGSAAAAPPPRSRRAPAAERVLLAWDWYNSCSLTFGVWLFPGTSQIETMWAFCRAAASL